ncbi:MAG: ATP-binding protein [Steroidobacteraceae bacterium]
MRLGIKRKLITAMLAASVLASLALSIAWHTSFQRGFLEYLNERGVDRLDNLAPQLAAAYREHGGWGFISEHAASWFELVGLPGGLTTAPPIGSPIPTTGRAIDATGIGLRIALLDDQHRFIIGIPRITGSAVYRPIIVDSRSVGWLVLVPFDRATSAIDVRFQRQQLLLTWTIGLLAVIVAGIGAVLLANAFLTPIHRIADATQRLTAGDYGVRLPHGSGDEIDQLASDVNQLALTLQRTEQQRRNLMADISHELRTPLAILRGEIEAVEDGVRADAKQTIKSLSSEVKILEKLVEDIYDVARSDVGALRYRREQLDLIPILQTCLTAFQERFAGRSLHVTLDCAEQRIALLADEARLQQLFNNLFENSARHTAAGGEVRISVRSDAEQVRIVVEDSKPGVSDEQLGHLFERFYRTDESRNRHSGGAGLGLAICRNIVEAHGGSIQARHSDLGGVQIELILPRGEG